MNFGRPMASYSGEVAPKELDDTLRLTLRFILDRAWLNEATNNVMIPKYFNVKQSLCGKHNRICVN